MQSSGEKDLHFYQFNVHSMNFRAQFKCTTGDKVEHKFSIKINHLLTNRFKIRRRCYFCIQYHYSTVSKNKTMLMTKRMFSTNQIFSLS